MAFLTYLFLFNQTRLGCSYLKQLWMDELICTTSSSIRTRSNCSMCLTSAITSLMISTPESWMNSVSECSAKSVQPFKAQSVIQGNIGIILPRAKMWCTRINLSVSGILFMWLHWKCRTDFCFLAARKPQTGFEMSAVFHNCIEYDWVQEYSFEHVGRTTVSCATPAYTQPWWCYGYVYNSYFIMMDANNECDRNSGFNIKLNAFIATERKFKRCETPQIDSAVPFCLNRIRMDSFATSKMRSRCQQGDFSKADASMRLCLQARNTNCHFVPFQRQINNLSTSFGWCICASQLCFHITIGSEQGWGLHKRWQ